MSTLPPHTLDHLEHKYVEQLDTMGKRLHTIAIKKLESSYFVKRTHGFKTWLSKQPTQNTQSQATT